MTTQAQREEWQRLCDEATDEPWVVAPTHDPRRFSGVISETVDPPARVVLRGNYNFPEYVKDEAFAAAARTALPALLVENERLREAVSKVVASGVLCDAGCCGDDCGCELARAALEEAK